MIWLFIYVGGAVALSLGVVFFEEEFDPEIAFGTFLLSFSWPLLVAGIAIIGAVTSVMRLAQKAGRAVLKEKRG